MSYGSDSSCFLKTLLLRIIGACGHSAILTGSFSMIVKHFPDNMATMFAIIEVFYGLGWIAGLISGGTLYEAGGFMLPFISLGIDK